jgi:hypothetical protein
MRISASPKMYHPKQWESKEIYFEFNCQIEGNHTFSQNGPVDGTSRNDN